MASLQAMSVSFLFLTPALVADVAGWSEGVVMSFDAFILIIEICKGQCSLADLSKGPAPELNFLLDNTTHFSVPKITASLADMSLPPCDRILSEGQSISQERFHRILATQPDEEDNTIRKQSTKSVESDHDNTEDKPNTGLAAMTRSLLGGKQPLAEQHTNASSVTPLMRSGTGLSQRQAPIPKRKSISACLSPGGMKPPPRLQTLFRGVRTTRAVSPSTTPRSHTNLQELERRVAIISDAVDKTVSSRCCLDSVSRSSINTGVIYSSNEASWTCEKLRNRRALGGRPGDPQTVQQIKSCERALKRSVRRRRRNPTIGIHSANGVDVLPVGVSQCGESDDTPPMVAVVSDTRHGGLFGGASVSLLSDRRVLNVSSLSPASTSNTLLKTERLPSSLHITHAIDSPISRSDGSQKVDLGDVVEAALSLRHAGVPQAEVELLIRKKLRCSRRHGCEFVGKEKPFIEDSIVASSVSQSRGVVPQMEALPEDAIPYTLNEDEANERLLRAKMEQRLRAPREESRKVELKSALLSRLFRKMDEPGAIVNPYDSDEDVKEGAGVGGGGGGPNMAWRSRPCTTSEHTMKAVAAFNSASSKGWGVAKR